MSDAQIRRLVRDLLHALRHALPAVRKADRAYQALRRATTNQRREAKPCA
jgi:hypothetical protein